MKLSLLLEDNHGVSSVLVRLLEEESYWSCVERSD
jgi:hypothetical protein